MDWHEKLEGSSSRKSLKLDLKTQEMKSRREEMEKGAESRKKELDREEQLNNSKISRRI